ncbi:MAG: Bax inhibitor-1/YccA family protein [Gammaproteobacteria bacterium]
MNQNYTLTQPSESTLVINKVLRNTYLLLGVCFLFSSAMAAFALVTNAPPLGIIITLVGVYGLMFATHALSNSGWGLVAVLAFTGFLGYTIGPILNFYMTNFSNGSQLVMTALGATGIIFFGLSGYALTTRKDFSYLSGFLFVGVLVAFLAILANIFLNIPGLQLAISAAFVLISSGLILFQTSAIINGGERNYIVATVTLFVALYNLFLSLLQLFAAFSGRD